MAGMWAARQRPIFTFSSHTPNSFDSRYFGPIKAEAIFGVYHPLVGLHVPPDQ